MWGSNGVTRSMTRCVEKALKRSYDRAHAAGDPRTPAQQRSDAIVEIFRHYLDGQPRGTNRPHIIYVVSVETISGGAVGICETLDGRRVSPEMLRRIACDSIGQLLIVDGDGVPLAMGGATRTFTPDQYRAIMVRDGGCRWPDCDAPPRDCEAHHGKERALGGLTDVDNGSAACRGRGHHQLVHEGGWTVRGDPNGELTFSDPDGNCRGSSRPRKRPPPILTRAGELAALARERARALAAA